MTLNGATTGKTTVAHLLKTKLCFLSLELILQFNPVFISRMSSVLLFGQVKAGKPRITLIGQEFSISLIQPVKTESY